MPAVLRLPCGRVTVVDDGLPASLLSLPWRYHAPGYIVANYEGERHLLHRLVAAYASGAVSREYDVHHLGNRLDNRAERLAIMTRGEHSKLTRAEQKPHGALGLKGVRRKGNKFIAYIRIDGVQRFLGSYDTVSEAAARYNEAALDHFGPNCFLNVV
jgi:hypothetical protein